MPAHKRRNLLRDDGDQEGESRDDRDDKEGTAERASREDVDDAVENAEQEAPDIGHTQKIERLADAADRAERWRVHHPDGSFSDFRESWRPSWGRREEPAPEIVPPGRASVGTTSRRSKMRAWRRDVRSLERREK
jgi:hypothetical protein